MADDTHAEKLGFEPFGTVDGVLRGAPIKIMPVGKFYRDERVLDITESDLREIERNVTAGLPRFRIPINENHGTDGKVGTVKAVRFMADGPDGRGLYATDYELTDAGKEAVKARKWDAVSPEMIWAKNGATYQDPQTGKRLDNVLVGLALCDKPYFGHENVALFTADGETPMDKPKRHNGYTKMRDTLREMLANMEHWLKDEDGDGVPDAEQAPDMNTAPQVVGTAAAVTTTSNIDAWTSGKIQLLNTAQVPVADHAEKPAADAAHAKGVDTMADVTPQPTPPATEQMTQVITAEQFAAVQAELAAQKQAAETFRVELAKTNRARRLDQLTARVETFMAISAEKNELAQHLLTLEEMAPQEFAYFDGLLGQLDGALVKADLFAVTASGKTPKTEGDTFADLVDKHWAEKYDRASDKYGDAAVEVSKANPALARGR